MKLLPQQINRLSRSLLPAVCAALTVITSQAWAHGHSTTCESAPNGGRCHVQQTLVWREISEVSDSEFDPKYEGKKETDLTAQCSEALAQVQTDSKPWVILHDNADQAPRAIAALNRMPPGSLVVRNWSRQPERGIASLLQPVTSITILHDIPKNREEAESIHGKRTKIANWEQQITLLAKLRDDRLNALETQGARVIDVHQLKADEGQPTVREAVKNRLRNAPGGLVIIIGHKIILAGENEDGTPRFTAQIQFHDGSAINLAEIAETKATLVVLSCSAASSFPRENLFGSAIFGANRDLSYDQAVTVAERLVTQWKPEAVQSALELFGTYQRRYVLPAAKDILSRAEELDESNIDSLESPQPTPTASATKPEERLPVMVIVQIDSAFYFERFVETV
ncbi:MAG TPA: hypothetical protein VK673_19375 [Chthoniobacterales bacterium]|nr:hypothetical protein [Verrucomicrobiota bacterium]HTD17356.1 hypothetical protein [Chthoniobacterales bacterium]